MHDLGSQQAGGTAATAGGWWRGAAIYQLYVRSFADGGGDGIGDLPGVLAHLHYLAELGIDAIWFNPWYPSPMSDAGYDIADYRNIDPVFGTLDDAQKLIDEAHATGIKIIIDIVPNHSSDLHPWFQAAVAAAPGSAERGRFPAGTRTCRAPPSPARLPGPPGTTGADPSHGWARCR